MAAHERVAGLAGVLVARRKPLAIFLHPVEHRGRGWHALVLAQRAQRASAGQGVENPIGDLGGVEGGAPGHAATSTGVEPRRGAAPSAATAAPASACRKASTGS